MDVNQPDPRPRIAHVISGLGSGGAERALLALLGGGLADRFESLVISLGDEGTMAAPIRATGAWVLTLDSERHYLTAVPLLRRMIIEFEPDIIQGWRYHGNLAATVARSFLQRDTRLVWIMRQTLYGLSLEKVLTRWLIRANRAFSRKADTILYHSGLSRQQHERSMVSVVIGHEGILRERILPIGERPDIRENYRALERIRANFALDAIVSQYETCYERVLTDTGAT